MKLLASLCILVSASLPSGQSLACSTFSLNSNSDHFMAKSYDWFAGAGLVMTNKRRVKKTSLQLGPQRPTTWVSKYGSITFNQYGREFPIGGVNEKGLVVETFWLAESEFPNRKNHPTVNELQWVQYQLDNFEEVDEVVAAINSVQIAPIYGKLHYKVCDRRGECVAIEFLNGKSVIHGGAEFNIQSLTNHKYTQALAYLKQFNGFGGKLPIPQQLGSLNRFVRISDGVRKFNGKIDDGLSYSFANLDRVRVGFFDFEDEGWVTKWQLVYDLDSLKVHFRTNLESDIKTLSINEFNFDCRAPVKILDINARISKGKKHGRFRNYSDYQNLKTIQTAVAPIKEKLPPGVVEIIANYPKTTQCLK